MILVWITGIVVALAVILYLLAWFTWTDDQD